MRVHRMRRLPTAIITVILLAGASALTAAGVASADTSTSLSSTVSLTVRQPVVGIGCGHPHGEKETPMAMTDSAASPQSLPALARTGPGYCAPPRSAGW